MITILNDVHIGFRRTSGTTPATQERMREWLFNSLESFLGDTRGKLVIAGDLFDDFTIPARDWVETFNLLSAWLQAKGNTLFLVAGNHDHSPRADQVSSFMVLGQVLQSLAPELVQVIGVDDYCRVDDRVWVLAHCSNQTLFDEGLARVQGDMSAADLLIVHANYNNNFAAEKDHSLNVSRDVARSFKAQGKRLLFAHEHQARVELGGVVTVMGNQWPTSVSDCLGNDGKFAHVIDDDGVVKQIPTWSSSDAVAGYREADWRELAESNADFVRVVGSATAAEAADVINAIAQFRKTSQAWVITNAVKVEGIAEVDELPENFEAAKKFDVMEFISQHLDADEMAVVKELMGEQP